MAEKKTRVEEEEEEDMQFEDAPPQEKNTLTMRKSKSTPRPMLNAAPSTPSTCGRAKLTARKRGHDTSDAEMPPPPIGSAPLHRTRATFRGAKGAKRKESFEPKPNSPAPKEVRRASTPIRPLKAPVDWCSIGVKDEFLIKTTEEFMVNAHSREGINIHVAAYFYTSDDWPLPTREQLASCVMKGEF